MSHIISLLWHKVTVGYLGREGEAGQGRAEAVCESREREGERESRDVMVSH